MSDWTGALIRTGIATPCNTHKEGSSNHSKQPLFVIEEGLRWLHPRIRWRSNTTGKVVQWKGQCMPSVPIFGIIIILQLELHVFIQEGNFLLGTYKDCFLMLCSRPHEGVYQRHDFTWKVPSKSLCRIYICCEEMTTCFLCYSHRPSPWIWWLSCWLNSKPWSAALMDDICSWDGSFASQVAEQNH